MDCHHAHFSEQASPWWHIVEIAPVRPNEPAAMNTVTNVFIGLVGIGSLGAIAALAPRLLPEIDIAGAVLLLGLAALAVACAVSFKYRAAVRQILALCMLSAGLAALAAEFTIKPQPKAYLVDGGAGGKSGRQAVLDLRSSGTSAYVSLLHSDITVPDESGRLQSVLKLNGEPLLPLGGVANTRTLLCNETGEWISYISDRYGFRNPESSWQGTPDIATVGDSYTQGNCVDDGHNFVDRLRTDYPKTLNLGQRGNGPFAILASIREYLGERRPKFTIWFHYEGNDIPSDLMRERRTPLFQRYLEPDFSQHLSDNAEAVSAAFARYIDRRLASASEISKNGRNQSQIWLSKVKSKLTLYRLRKRLGFANFPSRELIETFRAVLKRAKSDVGALGRRVLAGLSADPAAVHFGGRAAKIGSIS